MDNEQTILESSYNKYVSDMAHWLPDGILTVDVALLNHLNLLYNFSSRKSQISSHFHVFESQEKITLTNAQFAVWIVPKRFQLMPVTYVLIALVRPAGLHLEMAFSACGIYNNSRLILRILEKLLIEIQQTEEELHRLQ